MTTITSEELPTTARDSQDRHLTSSLLASYDLPDEVRWGIAEAGFLFATPIQEKVLPLTLAGRDVAGQAQTGTGKTAAFLITIFSRLLRRSRSGPARGMPSSDTSSPACGSPTVAP